MVQPRSSVRQGNSLPNPSPLGKGGFSSHRRPSPSSWFAQDDTDTPLAHHEEWSIQDGSTTDDSATLSPEIVSITQIGPRPTNPMRGSLTDPPQVTSSCDECCSDDSDLYITEVTGGVEQPMTTCRCGRDSMAHAVPVNGDLPVTTRPPAMTVPRGTPPRPNRPRETSARPVNGTEEPTPLRPPQGAGSSDNSPFVSSSDPFPSIPQALAPQPPPGVHPSPLAHRPSYHHDRFLVAPTVPKLSYEERDRVRQYWHALGLSQKLALLRMGKNEVAKAIRTQRKLSCSCSLCGRRRHKVETQLQDFYEAYQSSLINLVQARRVSPGKSDQPTPVLQTSSVAGGYSSPTSLAKNTAPRPKTLRKRSPPPNPPPGPSTTLPPHGVCPDCTSEIPAGPAVTTSSSAPNSKDSPTRHGTSLSAEVSSTVTTVFPYGISHHPFYCYTSSDEEEDYPEECGPGCDSCATMPHRLAPGATRPRVTTRELPTAGDFPSRPPDACPYECDETYVEELDDEYFDYLYGQQHGGNSVPLPYQTNPSTACELCTPAQRCPAHQPSSGLAHESGQDTGDGQDNAANFYIDPKWIANVIRNLRLQVQESIHRHHEPGVTQPPNPLAASPGQSPVATTPSGASLTGTAFGPTLPPAEEATVASNQGMTGEPTTVSHFLYNSSHVGRSHSERVGHPEVTDEIGTHAETASATPGQEPDWSLGESAEVDGEPSTTLLETSEINETRSSKSQLDLLRVAEDLFNNDGKRFLAMMEQYAKHRLQSESQRQQPSTSSSTAAVDYDEDNSDDYPTEEGPDSASPSATRPAADDTTSALFASAASALSAGSSFFRSLSKEKKELSLIMAESIATWFVDKKLMGRTARSVAPTGPPPDTAYPGTDQTYPWLETEFPLPPVETLSRSFPETLEHPDGSLGGAPTQLPVTIPHGEELSLVDDQVYEADMGYDHDYVDEEEDDFERGNNAVDLLASEEQQMEEARHAFQLLMTCLLENRVITSYREQVAQEKANELLRELDQDRKGKNGHSNAAKRKKSKEKRKPKKKSQREIQMEKEREAKERKRQQEEERKERETERERQRAQERKEREKVERKRQELEAQKRLAQLQKERAMHAKPNPSGASWSGWTPTGDQPAKGSPSGRGEDSTTQTQRTEPTVNVKVRKSAPTHPTPGTAARKSSAGSPTSRTPRHSSSGKMGQSISSPVTETRPSAAPRNSVPSGPVNYSLRPETTGQSPRESVVTLPPSCRQHQKITPTEPASVPVLDIPTSAVYSTTSVTQDVHLTQTPTASSPFTPTLGAKESTQSTTPLHTLRTAHPSNLNPAPTSYPPALLNTLMPTNPYDPPPRSAPATHFPASMAPGFDKHFNIPQYANRPGLAPGSSTTSSSQVSSHLPIRDLTGGFLGQPFFANLPHHHVMAPSVDSLRPSPAAPRHLSASLGYDAISSSSLLSHASPSQPTDLPSLLVKDLLEDDISDLTEPGLGTSSLDYFNRVHPNLLPSKTSVSRAETGFRGASLTVPSLSSLDYTSSSIWSPTVPPASATNLPFAPGYNRVTEPLRRHSSSFSAAFSPQGSRPSHPNPSPLEAHIPMARVGTTDYSTTRFLGPSSGSNGGPSLPSHQTDLLNQFRLGSNPSYGSSLSPSLAQFSNGFSHVSTSEFSRSRHMSDTTHEDLLKASSFMPLEAMQRRMAPGS